MHSKLSGGRPDISTWLRQATYSDSGSLGHSVLRLWCWLSGSGCLGVRVLHTPAFSLRLLQCRLTDLFGYRCHPERRLLPDRSCVRAPISCSPDLFRFPVIFMEHILQHLLEQGGHKEGTCLVLHAWKYCWA